jgi:hypothetical protein
MCRHMNSKLNREGDAVLFLVWFFILLLQSFSLLFNNLSSLLKKFLLPLLMLLGFIRYTTFGYRK